VTGQRKAPGSNRGSSTMVTAETTGSTSSASRTVATSSARQVCAGVVRSSIRAR
jgi:hypothetical protein